MQKYKEGSQYNRKLVHSEGFEEGGGKRERLERSVLKKVNMLIKSMMLEDLYIYCKYWFILLVASDDFSNPCFIFTICNNYIYCINCIYYIKPKDFFHLFIS